MGASRLKLKLVLDCYMKERNRPITIDQLADLELVKHLKSKYLIVLLA